MTKGEIPLRVRQMSTVLVLVLSWGDKHSQGKSCLKSCFRFLGLTRLFFSRYKTTGECKSILTMQF